MVSTQRTREPLRQPACGVEVLAASIPKYTVEPESSSGVVAVESWKPEQTLTYPDIPNSQIARSSQICQTLPDLPDFLWRRPLPLGGGQICQICQICQNFTELPDFARFARFSLEETAPPRRRLRPVNP